MTQEKRHWESSDEKNYQKENIQQTKNQKIRIKNKTIKRKGKQESEEFSLLVKITFIKISRNFPSNVKGTQILTIPLLHRRGVTENYDLGLLTNTFIWLSVLNRINRKSECSLPPTPYPFCNRFSRSFYWSIMRENFPLLLHSGQFHNQTLIDI